MITHSISLEMEHGPCAPRERVHIRRGDNETNIIKATLTDKGAAYKPTGTARLEVLHNDGTWARCSASISGDTVSCTLPSEALNGVGTCRLAYFAFVPSSGKRETTESFALFLEPDVDTDGTAGAESYDDKLEELYQSLTAFQATAKSQESARVSAENTRKASESARQENETARQKAEASRNSAEGERKTEEAERVSATASAIADATNAAALARAAAEAATSATREGSQDGPGSADALAVQVAEMGAGWVYVAGTIYGAESLALYHDKVIEPSDSTADGTTIILAGVDAAESLSQRLEALEEAVAKAQKTADTACDCPDWSSSLDTLSQQVAALAGWAWLDGTAYGTSEKASYASSALTLAASSASGTTITLA